MSRRVTAPWAEADEQGDARFPAADREPRARGDLSRPSRSHFRAAQRGDSTASGNYLQETGIMLDGEMVTEGSEGRHGHLLRIP